MIEIIKNVLRNSPFTRKMYAYLRELKLSNKQHKLQKSGVKLMIFVQNLLSSENVKFFFDMGTLLGIIREGHLLSHDFDLDIGVFATSEKKQQSIRDMLVSNNCRLIKACYVDNVGIIQESYIKYGIKFDIAYYYSFDDKIDSCFLFVPSFIGNQTPQSRDVLELRCDTITGTKTVDFLGISVSVPNEPEKYLAQRYGENWRLPDKNYKYWLGPSVHPYIEKGHLDSFE